MNNWIEKDNKLERDFVFEDFTKAVHFINQVANIAEVQNHHPQITNMYNKVNISLCTHDAGDIVTDKDRVVAEMIDDIV